MKNPSYYAIIPANVRYDKKLPPTAKLLYGEITALCNKEGCCWASNNYFSELYGLETRTITRLVSALKKQGYITVELIYKPDSKEIDKRVIRIVDTIDKNVYTSRQNCQEGIDKNVQDNNTSINNTIKSGKVGKVQAEPAQDTPFLDYSPPVIPKGSKTTDTITTHGADWVKWAAGIVTNYVEKVYPAKTGRKHPDLAKFKRKPYVFAFAKKILDCMDGVTTDDGMTQREMQAAFDYIASHDGYDDVDPTIYLLTDPRRLGYGVMMTHESGFEAVRETDYQPVGSWV